MRISPELPRGPLADAAVKVLTATLPGEGLVSRSSLDILLAAEPRSLMTLPASTRRIVSAAMIRTRVYSAMSDEAVELADFEAESMPRGAGLELAPEIRSICHAALSEAYLTAGRTKEGNLHARRAADYADEADDDACRYRAIALLACNLALNGEFARAAQAASRAQALEEANNWKPNTSALPLLLAEMMIAYAHLDADALEAVCDRLALTPSQGPIWVAFGQLATGWLHMLREQYDRALASVAGLTSGSDSPVIPRMISGFAIGLQAMALVHRGEAVRALGLLEGRQSPPGHALCFDLQRATAHLQLGENREALQATERCLRLGTDHNLRTLSSILLRHALANNRLGHTESADRAFAEAFHIMTASDALTPLLGLPSDELEELTSRLVANQPELAEIAARHREHARPRPRTRAQTPAPPRLTSRESVVAQSLRSDLPLGEIAARLHISSNTLKSQLRSLYAKLDVTSREQAVLRLERSGFYDRTPTNY